jgi:hypothetical protein
MTTTYDKRDFPSGVVFQDANGNTVMQVILARDGAGRLLSEETRGTEQSPFAELLEKTPQEERERMVTLIKNVLGGSFFGTTYAYDAQGRVVERLSRMGTLGEDRATYRYEDRDEPIEETVEHRNRAAEMDEIGTVRYKPDRVNLQYYRFEYSYDAHGSWTERVVWYRLEPNPDSQRSNIERRTITYHDA